MTPLALAMILTGAGIVAQKPDSPPVLYVPPPLPVPVPISPPPPYTPLPVPPPSPAIPSFLDRRAPLTTQPSYPRRARADFNTYFSVDDYPLRERRSGAEAQVGFALVIGPDGRVSRCTVTASSGSRRLDRATCEILERRARYSPARSVMGVAIDGRDSGIISWPVPPG
jgi:protein TonB